jgi:hypothetical protein
MKLFLQDMFSDSGTVSFGRCSAGLWCLFLMAMEVWYCHHFGALVDNSTLISHVAVVATLYGLGKFPSKT